MSYTHELHAFQIGSTLTLSPAVITRLVDGHLPAGGNATTSYTYERVEETPPGEPTQWFNKTTVTSSPCGLLGMKTIYRFLDINFGLDPTLQVWRLGALESRERTESTNRYAYGLNNPFRYVDPDGRDAVWVKHADGTATLVIPVTFSGSGATEANRAAIISRINGVAVLDPSVSIQAIATDKPIKGKLNRLDVSPGLDTKMCGPVGECANRLGGNRGHIDSTDDVARKGAHEVLHMTGIDDAYIEGPPDEQGRRTSSPKPGFTNSNIMTSREGTELATSQLQEAKNNRTTKQCRGTGTQCR